MVSDSDPLNILYKAGKVDQGDKPNNESPSPAKRHRCEDQTPITVDLTAPEHPGADGRGHPADRVAPRTVDGRMDFAKEMVQVVKNGVQSLVNREAALQASCYSLQAELDGTRRVINRQEGLETDKLRLSRQRALLTAEFASLQAVVGPLIAHLENRRQACDAAEKDAAGEAVAIAN